MLTPEQSEQSMKRNSSNQANSTKLEDGRDPDDHSLLVLDRPNPVTIGMLTPDAPRCSPLSKVNNQ